MLMFSFKSETNSQFERTLNRAIQDTCWKNCAHCERRRSHENGGKWSSEVFFSFSAVSGGITVLCSANV